MMIFFMVQGICHEQPIAILCMMIELWYDAMSIHVIKAQNFAPLPKNLVFFIGKSSNKIPNLNMHKKDHLVILDKLISTCLV